MLLHPDHVARLGSAVWVFLWLWRELSPEAQRAGGGELRGGRSIRVAEICQALGMGRRTVDRHLATLREHDYLMADRERRGFSGCLQLWLPQDGSRGVCDLPKLSYDKSGKSQVYDMPNLANLTPKTNPDMPDLANLTSGKASPPLKNPPRKEEEHTVAAATDVVPRYMGGSRERFPFAAAAPVTVPPKAFIPDSVSDDSAGGLPPGPGARLELIQRLLLRIEEHERPELTKALRAALLPLTPDQIDSTFDYAWRRRRTSGELRNPPAWWAELLVRAAELCRKLTAGDVGEMA